MLSTLLQNCVVVVSNVQEDDVYNIKPRQKTEYQSINNNPYFGTQNYDDNSNDENAYNSRLNSIYDSIADNPDNRYLRLKASNRRRYQDLDDWAYWNDAQNGYYYNGYANNYNYNNWYDWYGGAYLNPFIYNPYFYSPYSIYNPYNFYGYYNPAFGLGWGAGWGFGGLGWGWGAGWGWGWGAGWGYGFGCSPFNYFNPYLSVSRSFARPNYRNNVGNYSARGYNQSGRSGLGNSYTNRYNNTNSNYSSNNLRVNNVASNRYNGNSYRRGYTNYQNSRPTRGGYYGNNGYNGRNGFNSTRGLGGRGGFSGGGFSGGSRGSFGGGGFSGGRGSRGN